MEYKDYQTGQAISHEQYIKNGLERGELLVEEKCGCIVIQDRTADAYIVYCPKHEASPDLYEACLIALGSLVALDIKAHSWGQGTLDTIQKAIAKAEGKS